MGVDWTSEEVSDLVEPLLNLVMYMYLRIFAYTSNTLIASFEYMDCMLPSGTWENFRFSLRSCFFTERESVTKLMFSTFQPCRCIISLGTLRRDEYWFSTVDLTVISYKAPVTDIRLTFVFQNTEDVRLISHGWEDRYSVRSNPPKSFFHYCFH
jgi:hypothetical protein